MSEDDLWTSVAMCEARNILITDAVHYVYRKHDDSITGANVATIFRADNHMAVADDLYRYMSTKNDVPKDVEAWLCCKILYIASIAVKIYHDKKYYGFRLSLGMYQDLLKRLLASSDKYARNVGLMFGRRIIAIIKSINSACPSN